MVVGKPDWELGNGIGFRSTARQIVKNVAVSVPHAQLGGAVQLVSGDGASRTFRVVLIGNSELVSQVESELGKLTGVRSVAVHRLLPVGVAGVAKKFTILRGPQAVEAAGNLNELFLLVGICWPCGKWYSPRRFLALPCLALPCLAFNPCFLCRRQVRRRREGTGSPTGRWRGRLCVSIRLTQCLFF